LEQNVLTFANLALVWGVGLAIGWVMAFHMPIIMATAGGIVAFALVSEAYLVQRHSKILRVIGDASYSVYLFHFTFLECIKTAVPAIISGLAIVLQWATIILVIALAIAVGVSLHFLIERPLLKHLRPIASAAAVRFTRAGSSGPA
jgi:peptidoglycan/LPS O-acetylase OafA/YrhL